jgi:hypothetical protein
MLDFLAGKVPERSPRPASARRPVKTHPSALADALSHAQLQSFVAGANPHKRSKLTAKIPNRLMEVGTT